MAIGSLVKFVKRLGLSALWLAAVLGFAAALPTVFAVDGQELVSRWHSLDQRGSAALEKEHFEEADKLFSQALSAARQLGAEDVHVAVSISQLANLRRLEGLEGYARCENDRRIAVLGTAGVFLLSFLIAAMMVAPRFRGLSGIAIFWLLFVAAWAVCAVPMFQWLHGYLADEDKNAADMQFHAAGELFRQSLQLWDKQDNKNDQRFIETLAHYAIFLRQTNNLEEAKKMETRAWSAEAELVPKEHGAGRTQ